MKSFGRLLRRLRGAIPLETVGERAGLAPEHLTQIEAGELPVEEASARHILRRGLDLPRSDVDRLLLGIQLYDLGLKDNEIRQLAIAVIRREVPAPIQEELKQLYRRAIAA
jgi:transcriptional regulator with XRE-family HTH domain